MPSRQRILLVDDEQVLAQNIGEFLARRSADVRIACDGERAIEMSECFSPDVVVLDYGLPRMDGLRAYREILRRRARPPACVMITGYPLEKIAEPAARLGIRHLLCKPFSLCELQRLIELSAEDASRGLH